MSGLNLLKRGEVPEILPWLLPYNSLVVLGHGPVFGDQVEPVVRPGDDLGLALDHAHELQGGLGRLVVLCHCELTDLLHVRVVDVLNRLPPANESTSAADGGGQQGKDEKGEKVKAQRLGFHCNRWFLL
jgi:hypothetical protein